MPDGKVTYTLTARKVICAALALYCVGIIFLAMLPVNTLSLPEIFISSGAVIAILWLIGKAFNSIQIPGERWAYLLTGFLGLVTLLSYNFGADLEPSRYHWRASTMLLAGIVGAYGAHIAQSRDGL